MDIIVAVVVAIAFAIVVLLIVKNTKKKAAEAPVEEEEEEHSGTPELYALGMNPISDKPVMYALTTCQHCKNTKKFLAENNIEVTAIHLDDFNKTQRAELMEKVRTYNPRGTFPVIIFPGGKVVVGFRKHLIQEAMNVAGRTA